MDIQEDHFEMNYDALAEAITEKTKVVIPVELAGVPCDYRRIFEVVESKRGLFKPSTTYNVISIVSLLFLTVHMQLEQLATAFLLLN